MRAIFREDVEYWASVNSGSQKSGLSRRMVLSLFMKNMSVRAVFWFRLSHFFVSTPVPFVAGYLRRMLIRRFGLDIPPDIEIGGGLYIAHPVGVTVLAERIGKRCTIVGNVTLGKRIGDQGPIIGDDVYIGAGARVLGPILVGDMAKIGANAVVIEDVPKDVTVVGVPAAPVRRTPRKLKM
ncbi:hypothetical protein [Shimia sp. R9_3]|uniref:serine O-acetyltransferase n=1 Tax=Shimia sp. R9_3 TaxID=2821113 RepID=UPI001ADB9A7F|nr:hypothetical protein [Shimia sp. R9_3]MBO9403263.1 hypothetical protein [Shimia sp. R9_3]